MHLSRLHGIADSKLLTLDLKYSSLESENLLGESIFLFPELSSQLYSFFNFLMLLIEILLKHLNLLLMDSLLLVQEVYLVSDVLLHSVHLFLFIIDRDLSNKQTPLVLDTHLCGLFMTVIQISVLRKEWN